MLEVPYRRMLRARLEPLTITAALPEDTAALRLDPELLWAARLVEFEQVEIRDRQGGCWQVPVLTAAAGEVEVRGDLCRFLGPGDVISVLAYAYATQAETEAPVHWVEIGEGNRALEISCRQPRSFSIHPSFAAPFNPPGDQPPSE